VSSFTPPAAIFAERDGRVEPRLGAVADRYPPIACIAPAGWMKPGLAQPALTS